MSFARIKMLLPVCSTVETTLLTAAFVAAHLAAYLDREQDIESNTVFTLSLLSKLVGSLHTLATAAKVWENFDRANRVGLNNYTIGCKIACGTTFTSAVATAAGIWSIADSKINLVVSVTNSASNFFGRTISSAHLNSVVSSHQEVNFDNVNETAPDNVIVSSLHSDSDEAEAPEYQSLVNGPQR